MRSRTFDNVNIVLADGAKMPTRGSTEAAGYDVHANLGEGVKFSLVPLVPALLPTGIFLDLPQNSVLLMCSRSGLACKGVFLPNAPGIVDSDYRGEVKVPLIYVAHPGAQPFIINHGDRIGQMVFVHSDALMYPNFLPRNSVDQLRPADRGSNGFGSTGR